MTKDIYGYTNKGKNKIVAPNGWAILSEGEEVPQVHREHLELYGLKDEWYSLWADPRRCHSTMTPLTAQICGAVRAVAIKTVNNDKVIETLNPQKGVRQNG